MLGAALLPSRIPLWHCAHCWDPPIHAVMRRFRQLPPAPLGASSYPGQTHRTHQVTSDPDTRPPALRQVGLPDVQPALRPTIFTIFEVTSEIQRMLIGRAVTLRASYLTSCPGAG